MESTASVEIENQYKCFTDEGQRISNIRGLKGHYTVAKQSVLTNLSEATILEKWTKGSPNTLHSCIHPWVYELQETTQL